MDIDGLKPLEILAEKVEALLDRCDELDRKNKELERQLQAKDEEIEPLRRMAGSFDQERAQVREKIDSVLARISQYIPD